MKTQLLASILLLLMMHLGTNAQLVTTIQNSSTEKFSDGLALDEDGNIYCSDYLGDKIFKRSPDGEVTVFAEGLSYPNGLAFDSQSNLYVCANGEDAIYKIDIDGVFIDTFLVSGPSDIIKSLSSDSMYFSQYFANGLNILAPDGTVIPMHTGVPLNGPIGLAIDESGQLYVGNFNDRIIHKATTDALEYLATVPGPSNGALAFITYGDGTLWGTSYNANSIYRIETASIDNTMLYAGSTLGTTDGPIAEATFARPNGIVTSSQGDTIYVSQYQSGELRMISPMPLSTVEWELNDLALSVYPNPGIDKAVCTFELEEGMELNWRVMDVQGKTHSSGMAYFQSGSNQMIISTIDLPANTYVIEWWNKEVQVRKEWVKSK